MRSGGLELSCPLSLSLSSLQSGEREKTLQRPDTHTITRSVTHPLIFIIAVLERREKSGIEVSEKRQTRREAEKDFVNKHFKKRLVPAERMKMSNMKRNEVCVCV